MSLVENNIYKTPQANLEISGNSDDIHSFKRFSAWGVFGLSVITIGLYPIYWLYSRSKVSNMVHKNKISPLLLNSFLLIAVVSYSLSMISVFIPDNETIVILEAFSNLPYIVIYLVVLFKLRNRLQDFTGASINGFFTFFGWVIYLQYKINVAIDSGQS